jgi:hypothetical protein
VDREQAELAIELLRDVAEYADDTTVDKALTDKTALGKLLGHVLHPESTRKPSGPYADAVKEWEALVSFVESRLRPE